MVVVDDDDDDGEEDGNGVDVISGISLRKITSCGLVSRPPSMVVAQCLIESMVTDRLASLNSQQATELELLFPLCTFAAR